MDVYEIYRILFNYKVFILDELISFITLLISFYVFGSDIKRNLNKILFLILFFTSIYTFLNGVINVSIVKFNNVKLIYYCVTAFVVNILATLCIVLMLYYPKRVGKRIKYVVPFLFLIPLIFLYFSMKSEYVRSIRIFDQHAVIEYGYLYYINTAYGSICAVSAIVYLFTKSFKGKERVLSEQNVYLGFSLLCGFLSTVLMQFLLPYSGVYNLDYISGIGILCMDTLIVYALNRYNDMENQISLKKLSLWIPIIIVIGLFASWLNYSILKYLFVSNTLSIIIISFNAVILFSVFANPLRRIFYKYYPITKSIENYSSILGTIGDSANIFELSNKVLDFFEKRFNFSSSGFFLKNSREKRFNILSKRGSLEDYYIRTNDQFIDVLERWGKPLDRMTLYNHHFFSRCLEDMEFWFNTLNVKLIVPIMVNNKLVALIVLNKNRSLLKNDILYIKNYANEISYAYTKCLHLAVLKKQTNVIQKLRKFVAPNLLNKIMESDYVPENEGNLKNVTVLFADLRGFTSLAERFSPGEIVTLLNQYFEIMVKIVFKFNGVIDKYMGDCFMAVWGTEISRDIDPLLAARSAIEMKAALYEFNSFLVKKGTFPLEIGVGINTGNVILGNIGSSNKLEYTVIGDNVNIASRLERMASNNVIYISDPTYEKIKRHAVVSKLPITAVKGKREKIKIYSLDGVLDFISRKGEKRRYPRFVVSVIAGVKKVDDNIRAVGLLTNIGFGGAAINIHFNERIHFDKGDEIVLDIKNVPMFNFQKISGKITRVTKTTTYLEEIETYELGIKYIGVPEGLKDNLKQYLRKRSRNE